MTVKLIGSLTDPQVLKKLGFAENTSLNHIFAHWQKVERTFSANVYRAENIKKESVSTYKNRNLTQTPFSILK